jgi:hypothetical protein
MSLYFYVLSSKEYRRRWQDLIKKVYEIDPLICPKWNTAGDGKIL